ncbi:hypothetical protein M3570_21175, partial [Bacillus subtilis]|nr:hypothetical protein [Bacillus subtilis]
VAELDALLAHLFGAPAAGRRLSAAHVRGAAFRRVGPALMSDEILPLKKKPPNPMSSTVFEGTKLTAPREVRQERVYRLTSLQDC